MTKIGSMKTFFEGFLVYALLAWGSSAAFADNNISIIVFGDSLTSGYQLQPDEAFSARLERKLKESGFTTVSVKNMSVAAETTAGGLERVHAVIAQRPDIVIVELGSNDALRGINPTVIYTNLTQTLQKLAEQHIYIILVGVKAPSNMGYSYGAQLEAVYQKSAEVYKTLYYPFALEGIVGRQDLNLADGYHPSAKGVGVMVNNMYPTVDQAVRWKWEALRYQQEYQQEYQRQLMQDDTPMPGHQNAPQQPADTITPPTPTGGTPDQLPPPAGQTDQQPQAPQQLQGVVPGVPGTPVEATAPDASSVPQPTQ